MSYTPTTWTTGDTITATKMNKIEQGIAGIGGNPLITFNFDGFASSSYIFNFAIGELDEEDDVYIAKKIIGIDDVSTLEEIYIFAPDGEYIYPLQSPVPKADGLALLFIQPSTNYFATTVSGNISQTTVTVNYGTVSDAYIVTGDCTINIEAI